MAKGFEAILSGAFHEGCDTPSLGVELEGVNLAVRISIQDEFYIINTKLYIFLYKIVYIAKKYSYGYKKRQMPLLVLIVVSLFKLSEVTLKFVFN